MQASRVDALPYYDQYEGMESAVLAELARDMTPPKPMAEYLAHLPAPPTLGFEDSVFLATEFNRIRAGKPSIKFARRAKGPPSDPSDAAAWELALANAKAELGYHNSKMINLQLLKKYGKDAWTAHNEELSQNKAKEILERESEEVKIEVNQINFNRKREHEKVGAKLSSTEAKYWSTLSNIDAVGKAVETLAKRARSAAE